MPSEIIAAFLWAQLENLDVIQAKRKILWQKYYDELKILEIQGKIKLPLLPDYATNNAHMMYVVFNDLEQRTRLIERLKEQDIHAVFHYISLHKSAYYLQDNDFSTLPNSDFFTDNLLRLPMYFELTEEQQKLIISSLLLFFENES